MAVGGGLNSVGDDNYPSCSGLRVGDRMRDGTVFAGISSETGRVMYAMPEDAPLVYTFREAASYARQLNAIKYLGHDDWRVPERNELQLLFNNCAAIGGFGSKGYWSSTKYGNGPGWCQRFNDGEGGWLGTRRTLSLRCVRG